MLAVVLAGLVIVAVLVWLVLNARKAQADSAGQAALALQRAETIEVDALKQSGAIETLQLETRALREQLDMARDEIARQSERASRVPALEQKISHLEEVERNQQLVASDLRQKLGASEATSEAQSAKIATQIPALEQKIALFEENVKNLQMVVSDLRQKLGAADATSEAQSAKCEQLQASVASISADLGAARADVSKSRAEIARLTSEVDAAGKANSLSVEKINFLEAELTSSRDRNSELALTNSKLNSELANERSQTVEKLKLLTDAKTQLADQFKSLANDILEDKSKRFTEQNKTSLSELLTPLQGRLLEFQAKVEQVYIAEGKERTALGEQVKHLMTLNQTISQEAKNLTHALKGSNKTQGNWGELVLERLLEDAGLTKGREFTVQDSRRDEEGARFQPDVVIHLPGKRDIVVDSKVSLIAYDQYANLEEGVARSAALKSHIDSMKKHYRELGTKNYPKLYGLSSLDFVIMFVPIESAYVAAVANDSELAMEAFKQNVLVVSPLTLLFVLRVIAQLWSQEDQNRNAQDIAKRGADLYDRLVAFVVDLEKVGERLNSAQESFVSARDKLSKNKGNVIRQAEMLRNLGVRPTKSMPQGVLDASDIDSTDILLEVISGDTKIKSNNDIGNL